MPRKPKAEKPPDPDIELFELYGGQVQIRFKDSSHRYSVKCAGDEKFGHCPSVTTILNVLAKPALISWACNAVANFTRERFLALVEQNKFSVADVLRVIEESRNASDKLKDEAADIGIQAHDFLHRHWQAVIRKTDLPVIPSEAGPIKNCIEAALDWVSQHHVEPVLIEHPLYTRKHQITGRPDFIGRVDGELCVLDYKSTKAIYPELALQMAAYATMYGEEYEDLPRTRWGLRMDKLTGEFEDRCYKPDTLDQDFNTFMAAFTIYDRLKHLRRKPKEDTWLEEL